MDRIRARRHEMAFDEMFAARDQPATEPLPQRDDPQEHLFESVEGLSARCEADGSRVRIQATGDLRAVEPLVGEHARLDISELAHGVEGVETPRPFRPAWLDLMTAPRILPHRLAQEGPVQIRPLVFESTGTDWPWSTIGKLFINRRGQKPEAGSGVLVGPNLLLTVSHAMPWDTGDASIRFVPGYRNGNDPRFGHAFVNQWRGVVNSDSVTGLDYVICQLNWRIGDRTGWMGSQWWSDEDQYYDRNWISVGYPRSEPNGGERPSIEIPVRVEDIDNDGDGLEIETDMFALGGWSGGPLWRWIDDEPRVVGIESGFEKDIFDPWRSVFAGGEHMVNLVKHGWANWT